MMDKMLLSPGGTELLCENIVNTKYEDLSEENLTLFKDRLLDMTGCILGGSIVPENDSLEKRYEEWGGLEEAPVFASSYRMPLPNAVMLNAIKARSNDFGSMLFKMHGERMPSHMGETVIPLGLTLADTLETSGRDFIVNDIAGEDFAGRLLYCLPVRFPVDMLLVASAAAAVAGRYYRLDAQQMKAALSYAAANATDPANAYYDYSQEVYLHNGVSAQTGIMSAEYARNGWKGFADPYFGNAGLISSRVEDGNYPALYEKLFEGLGRVYYTECAFKYMPGGIPMTAVSLAGCKVHQMLLARYGRIDAQDIRAVHVYGASTMYHGYYSNPFLERSHLNALFAYRFAAACTVLYGQISVQKVQTDAIRADQELVRLAENASMDVFEAPAGPPVVRVAAEMKNGEVLEAQESFMALERYPDRDTLVRKFRSQFEACGVLPASRADKIIELAYRIDELSNMKEYTQLLCLEN